MTYSILENHKQIFINEFEQPYIIIHDKLVDLELKNDILTVYGYNKLKNDIKEINNFFFIWLLLDYKICFYNLIILNY